MFGSLIVTEPLSELKLLALLSGSFYNYYNLDFINFLRSRTNMFIFSKNVN